MALLFMDSFDHYATADITEKWTAINVTPEIGAYGRNGTNGVRCQASTSVLGSEALEIGLPVATTGIIGFAAYFDALPGAPALLVSVFDGSYSRIQLGFFLGADGGITVRTGEANSGTGWWIWSASYPGTLVGTSAGGVISEMTWCFIELKWTINNTTGAFEVRVNGTEVLAETGLNTRNTGSASNSFSSIGLGVGKMSASIPHTLAQFDDVYVLDTSGAHNNDFLGDVTISAHFPDADGTSHAWVCSTGTPDTGVDHDCVDEVVPNDDTDYLSTNTIDAKSTFALADAAAGANIKAIQIVTSQRKAAEGPGKIKHVVRSNSTDYDQTEQGIGGMTYSYLRSIVETDPATGVAWDEAGFNAVEIGIKKTA